MTHDIHIIGGGLAGSEAAWQLAEAGLRVRLSEMRGANLPGGFRAGKAATDDVDVVGHGQAIVGWGFFVTPAPATARCCCKAAASDAEVDLVAWIPPWPMAGEGN